MFSSSSHAFDQIHKIHIDHIVGFLWIVLRMIYACVSIFFFRVKSCQCEIINKNVLTAHNSVEGTHPICKRKEIVCCKLQINALLLCKLFCRLKLNIILGSYNTVI